MKANTPNKCEGSLLEETKYKWYINLRAQQKGDSKVEKTPYHP